MISLYFDKEGTTRPMLVERFTPTELEDIAITLMSNLYSIDVLDTFIEGGVVDIDDVYVAIERGVLLNDDKYFLYDPTRELGVEGVSVEGIPPLLAYHEDISMFDILCTAQLLGFEPKSI